MSRPYATLVVFLLVASTGLLAELPAVKMTPVADGFHKPTHIASAGDDRLFVVEQPGLVWIVRNGERTETPFLDIRDRVFQATTECCDEQGLLSIAFPPDFETRQHFYVFYVDPANFIRVSRFRVTEDPDVAEPASEEPIFSLQHLYENHYGGQLAFHPVDGKLYVSIGDGGGGGDPLQAAMDPDQLFGKIFRIDVETGDFAPEVWAMGFRNPWRFSFDRATGDFYGSDVGEDTWEEFNFAPAGSDPLLNFGWSILEGNHCYREPDCDASPYIAPIFEYNHEDGCSATGGFVYRGSAIPELRGAYLGADFCQGTVFAITRDGESRSETQVLLEATGLNISSFGEDAQGELYVTDFVTGNILRIEKAAAQESAPNAVAPD